MKNNSSKRALRIENKKKKMAALLEIVELNENDRKVKNSQIKTDLEPSPKKVKTNKDKDNDKSENNIELGPKGKPKLSGEEFKELKRALRERTLRRRHFPIFRLRDMGTNASLATDVENRVPLFLSDIQHLIMYSQVGHHSPYSPARWCALEKFTRLVTTSVLIVENISMNDFIENQSNFPFLQSNFQNKLEVLHSFSNDVVKDLSLVPLTGTQMKKFITKFGTLKTAVIKSTEIFDTVKTLFPIKKPQSEPTGDKIEFKHLPSNDKFPRTQLLLSGWQMVEENYPLPIKGLMKRKYMGYILTKDKYESVTPLSRMFGLDCEMCVTTSGDLELTRVSLVDEELNTFYDTLVKPHNKITNYLTEYSGITAKMMRNVTKRLAEVQADLKSLLPSDAILVGQSLGNDLHALKMMHPYVIDTSIIYNITGERNRKTKLKTLTREFLSQKIQTGFGHCSTEDSSAALKLTQLKLRKSLYFGDAVMGNVQSEIRAYHELGTSNYATSMLKHVTKVDKSALVVGPSEISHKYKYYVDKGVEQSKKINNKIVCLSEATSDNIVKKMCDNMATYSLLIGHTKEDANVESFKRIDNNIKYVYEKQCSPGLVIVVFGGRQDANGGCFIQTKVEF